MKPLILIVFLFSMFEGFGQKKKKTDPKDVLIDSLTRTNTSLSGQIDSISKEKALYYGLYTTIKEKVLLKDFDPEKFPQIVDSIRQSRDSSNVLLQAPIAGLRDSLATVTKENAQLKEKMESMSLTAQSADKSKLVTELKDLKALLDAKVITQAEYDAKKKLVMDKWQ